jgi:type II secretory pathway pseudopilin PulG
MADAIWKSILAFAGVEEDLVAASASEWTNHLRARDYVPVLSLKAKGDWDGAVRLARLGSARHRSLHSVMSKSCVRWRGTKAFTLLEIGMATLLVGLLAVVAVPQCKKFIVAARSKAVINDLHAFTRAFQAFLREKGDWPPGQVAAGQIPPGMAGYLRQSNWEKITPIGGYYHWEKNRKHNDRTVRAAIVISSQGRAKVTADRVQLEDIDRKCDDGNLATGSFLLGFANAPLYILEP